MSNHVSSLLRRKRLGLGSTVKSIALLMADLASDDGSGVWASKETMADELETTTRTIRRAIKALVDAGFVAEIGTRKHRNGFTVEYAMDVSRISKCPDAGDHDAAPVRPKTGHTVTPDTPSPLTHRHPTPDSVSPQDLTHCHPNQIKPSLNQSIPPVSPKPSPPAKAHLPEDWTPSDQDREYALSKNLNDAEIEEIADDFRTYWSERSDAKARKTERGWHQTWRNRIVDVSAKYIRNRQVALQAIPGGYGRGGGIAGAVARRRFGGQN